MRALNQVFFIFILSASVDLTVAGIRQSVNNIADSGVCMVNRTPHGLLPDFCPPYAFYVYLMGFWGASRQVSHVCWTMRTSVKKRLTGERKCHFYLISNVPRRVHDPFCVCDTSLWA